MVWLIIIMMRREMKENKNEMIFFPSILLNQNFSSTIEKSEKKRDVERFYDH